jgi:AI-2 transport protein TqsA
MSIESWQPRLMATALWIVVVFVAGYILIMARDLLIPLVLAVFIWYLINLIARQLDRLRIAGLSVPGWLQFVVAGLVIVAAASLFVRMLAANITQVIEAAPVYQANIDRQIQDWMRRFGVDEGPTITALLAEFDVTALLRGAATGLGTFLGNTGLILIYLVFLFLEQRYFRVKLEAILRDPRRRATAERILADIDQDIATYVGIKTLVSVLTATGAWVIMRLVGLDFASFWAILIFILNFIPNVGSIVATLLPALLALVQFDTVQPFLIILLAVGGLQMLVGNFLEPNLMGRSLNISPLVVLLSLVLWGRIWGIPGMFLCVPITVVIMIVLFRFDSTRWLAQLLSRDGRVRSADVPATVTP